MFHQDLSFFGCFKEDLVLVWYGLVWRSIVRVGFRQHPSEVSVKFSLRSIFFFFGCFRENSVLVLFGMVWFVLA